MNKTQKQYLNKPFLFYNGETEEAFLYKHNTAGKTINSSRDKNCGSIKPPPMKIIVIGEIPTWMQTDSGCYYGNPIIQLKTLKERIDEVFIKYNLKNFGFTNWKVSVITDYYRYINVYDCIEKSVIQFGELAHGDKINKNTVIKHMLKLEMITMQEFTEWFATKMLIWPWHNSSDDISVISEQLKGITSLATDYGFNYTSLPRLQTKNSNIHKEGKPAKYLTYNLYKTNIPFGYLDGGVFAFHCQETEEIVIMMIYGSD